MKHQQLQMKQNNVWSAYTRDPLHFPMSLPGEYEIIPGKTMDEMTTDSADLSLFTQAHPFNGQSWLVTTFISAKEFRHLLVKVSLAELFIFALLLGAIIIVNRKSSTRLWTPFYKTMSAIRGYDIRHGKPLHIDGNTGVEEFNQLNDTLLTLIGNVDQAYRNQKQFTENASHELQTPLAIIRSKVELLTESLELNEDNAQLLQEITEANERLSQMNKNLLLLARIDNSQFPEVSSIDLSGGLERLVRFFREYYDNEVPKTTISIQPNIHIAANPSLVEILLNNLLRNAYIHNIPGGWVDIRLAPNVLTITNSGPAIEGDAGQMFDRFRKGRVDNRSTGLGLALVRQIAQLYRYDIEYHYEDGRHRLTLTF